MRTEMPTIAEWVDALVAAFGKDEIHGQIRRGMAGEPCFSAFENGHTIGVAPVRGRYRVRWNDRDEAQVEPIDAVMNGDAGIAGSAGD